MLREVPMNARVYIGLKLLFANGVGSQQAVISKNFQYKKIFQNLEHIQPIMHQYMLPKLHQSAIYIFFCDPIAFNFQENQIKK